MSGPIAAHCVRAIKTVISAEGKMTGQLSSCLANCVLLLSLSLISILGSEILIGTLLALPPFRFSLSGFCLLVPFLFSIHVCSPLVHEPHSNYVLDWQYRLSRTLCILHFLAPQ